MKDACNTDASQNSITRQKINMAITKLSQHNFKAVIESNPFVVIDFWAEWCEPCLIFSKTFENVASKHADIMFCTLDTETDPEIASYFNIEQIPCVLAIKNQIVIDGIVGVMPNTSLESSLQQWRDFDTTEINRHFAEKAK